MMKEGYRIKPVTRAVAIGSMLPEARDLMDQALEEWGKFEKETQETFPEFPSGDGVHAFAYWLFRWSGLIQYDVED
jgi:hypothetical protein